MNDKLIRSVFWIMVALFFIVVCTMFVFIPLLEGFPFGFIVLPGLVIFLGLGVALLVLTVKKKVTGLLRKFLLLTGACAAGLPVFAVLHNLVTALCIKFFGFGADFDEPVFFTIATLVCPIGFLVGMAGTITVTIRNRQQLTTGIP